MNTEDADQVLLATARLVMGISVRAADQVGSLSAVQLRALTVLRDLAAPNLVQLTEAMGVTVSTTSRLVDRLVAADLVDRRPSEATRREVRLSLTAHGTDVLRTYDRIRVRALRERLEGLAPDEQEALVHGLRRLTGQQTPPAAG